MNMHAEKIADKKSQAVANNLPATNTNGKATFRFTDNRPGTVAQRKLQDAISNSPRGLTFTAVQENARRQSTANDNSLVQHNSGGVIQKVGFKKPWTEEEGNYQGNKVGKSRLPGDALWLAIARFTKNVSDLFKSKHTVQEVIDEAKKTKGVEFEAWKGTQADETSREAQHLVTSSFATKVLKWPFRLINSAANGIMLLAGRNGKGEKFTPEYENAKQSKGKDPKDGIRHIGGGNGFSHPEYSQAAEDLIRDEYVKNGYTIGQKVPDNFAYAIMAKLRAWHKQFDRTGTKDAVDEQAHTLAYFSGNPKAAGNNSNNNSVTSTLLGGAGALGGALLGASYGSALGPLGTAAGAALGGLAGWWAAKKGASYL